MSDTALSYPVDARNRVRRHHERGAYDHDAVHAVLDAGMLCHVAYVFDGQPYCTPTLHWREGEMLYWHGSSASRMLRGQRAGVPVCVTVSHLDGIVLARRGLNHSANYRAAMCFGTARIVDDPAEKAQALAAVIDRFLPGRSGRGKPNSAQSALKSCGARPCAGSTHSGPREGHADEKRSTNSPRLRGGRGATVQANGARPSKVVSNLAGPRCARACRGARSQTPTPRTT